MSIFCILVDKGIQPFGDNSAVVGDKLYIQYISTFIANYLTFTYLSL